MILADVSFSAEEIAIVAGMMSILTGAIAYMFRLGHSSITADRDSWKQMYFEQSVNVYKQLREKQERTGQPMPKHVAAVVPESSSPPTKQQIETADIATERARLEVLSRES